MQLCAYICGGQEPNIRCFPQLLCTLLFESSPWTWPISSRVPPVSTPSAPTFYLDAGDQSLLPQTCLARAFLPEPSLQSQQFSLATKFFSGKNYIFTSLASTYTDVLVNREVLWLTSLILALDFHPASSLFIFKMIWKFLAFIKSIYMRKRSDWRSFYLLYLFLLLIITQRHICVNVKDFK